MNKCRFLFFAVLLFCFAANNVFALNGLDYMPLDKPITAKVMALQTNPELIPIAKQLSHAVAMHQQWFKAYVAKLKPGQIMPYHPNLGITKQEYDKFVTAGRRMQIKKVDSLTVMFQTMAPGKYVLKTSKPTPVDGLIITQHEVTTPYGIASKISIIDNQDNESPLGAWQGVQWCMSTLNEDAMQRNDLRQFKALEVKLALGMRQLTGEGLLYYSVREINVKARKNTDVTYILLYSLD